MDYPKFQIYRGRDDQFYFRLCARNAEIILRSEGYTAKASCTQGVRSVQENAPKDERYERKRSADGQHYFLLTAPNGEVIGVSERYTTERRRDEGIEAVKKTAPDSPVEDIA